MPPTLEIIMVLMTLSLAIIIGQPQQKGTKGTWQTGQLLPAILSGDQSLPASGVLPIGSIPTDLMAGGVNQMQSQGIPVVTNNMEFTGGRAPVVNGNSAPVNYIPGQAEYPVAMEPVNNPAVLSQSNNVQIMNQIPEGKRMSSSAINGMRNPPRTMSMHPPMNMNYQQWASPMSANIVLRNIQMACSTLQNFVLDSPLAREITASVSNMNNMAEIFNSPTQCGFPALSTTLRVFLKTCNIYSSCSNPTPSRPSPVQAQPISPEVPYNVQQQMGSIINAQTVAQQPRPVGRPPVAPPPFLRQQYQAFQRQIMIMFNWLHNNFRNVKQTTNTSNTNGQKKQAKNATTVPFDD